MTVWLAFVIGCAFGAVVGAVIAWRSYRDELAMREAWEDQAREVIRDLARLRQYTALSERARRLLADEAGA